MEVLAVNGMLISWQKLNPTLREWLTLCGAILFLTALIFIWAAFFRKRFRPRRRSRRNRSRSAVATISTSSSQSAAIGASGSPVLAVDSNKSGDSPAPGQESRRRRHRERTMNPTLAQTGGLPRLRAQGPPDSTF